MKGYTGVIITEENKDVVINMLMNSKGKFALVAVNDLEDECDIESVFERRTKSECVGLLDEAVQVAAICDGFVKSLRAYTKRQTDLYHIKPLGRQSIILLRT